MTQELTQQWLTEIKELKQQIAERDAERFAGWESAEKWRKLYNIEAEQRRTDANLFQQTIAALKAEIQKLHGIEEALLTDGNTDLVILQEIEPLKSVDELKAKLIGVMKERAILLQALKTEQTSHAQTRKSLTTALGDAIDSLTRERGE